MLVAKREPVVTDRLILCDIIEADAESMFELDSHPEVMRYLGPRPAPDVAAYRGTSEPSIRLARTK